VGDTTRCVVTEAFSENLHFLSCPLITLSRRSGRMYRSSLEDTWQDQYLGFERDHSENYQELQDQLAAAAKWT